MEEQRHGKHRTKHGIPPLLVCWLIAVGLMILISSNGNSYSQGVGAPTSAAHAIHH